MNYDKYKYKVICEDETHYRVIYHFLKMKNVGIRAVHQLDGYANGKGDGKKHVWNVLENAKKDYKRTQNSVKTIYIVVRDADNQNYENVKKELDCETYENIFLVIPKRNIETWLTYFTNFDPKRNINEERDYKTKEDYDSSDCVKCFIQVMNSGLSETAPDSLRRTVASLKKCEQKNAVQA